MRGWGTPRRPSVLGGAGQRRRTRQVCGHHPYGWSKADRTKRWKAVRDLLPAPVLRTDFGSQWAVIDDATTPAPLARWWLRHGHRNEVDDRLLLMNRERWTAGLRPVAPKWT